MAAEWFVIVKDEIRGPYSADQMRAAAKSGIVKASTNVRKGSEGDWFRADQIQGLLPTPGSPPNQSQQQAPARPEAALPSEPPVTPEVATAIVAPIVTTVDGRSTSRPRVRGPSRRRSNPWPVIAVGALAVGLLLVMLYVLANSGGGPPTKTKPTPPASRIQQTKLISAADWGCQS